MGGNYMKKFISAFLAIVLLVSVLSIGATAKETTVHPLDGKKIIFIGNSFTYYGKTVIDRKQVFDDASLNARIDDHGYFYYLCKNNGANVSVTNWTWGGHTLTDTFGGSCAADRGHDGHDHLADLKRISDMKYDYVVIQPGSADTAETAARGVALIKDLFSAANPDVKFIFNVHPRYYLRATENDKNLVASIDTIVKDYNLMLSNWGVLVSDLIYGNSVVENTNLEYNKNTFIITKSADDGYHPNMLSGYITTQMIYSVITGEKALGEDYSFCTSTTLENGEFKVSRFLKNYYKYDNISPAGSATTLTGDDLTTFPEIFASPTDMAGIQKLIDTYIQDYYSINSYNSATNSAEVVFKKAGKYKVFFVDYEEDILKNIDVKSVTVSMDRQKETVSMNENNTFPLSQGDRIMVWDDTFSPVCESFEL